MLQRALLVVALLAAASILAGLAQLWSRRRLARLKADGSAPLWAALGTRPDGRPTIVAFSTPGCAVCISTQDPALRAVAELLGPDRVRMIRVDASQRPDVAGAFSIVTAPTTVVIGADGGVRAANNGFASAERLVAQLTGS